jgi:hypothetical protein
MSLVGYDPVLVDALRRRMRTAADDLAAIHSSDPAAAGVVAAATAIRRLLEWTWMPAIGDLLLTDPLGRGGAGDTPDPGSSSMWSSLGLSSSAGPAPAGPIPAGDINGTACAIPDDMVVRRIDALADERATLIASVGPSPDDPEDIAALAAIDARIAAVARAYVASLPRSGHAPLSPRALLDTSPYASALALRAVHDQLDPHTLAAIGLLIVQRWHANSDHRTGWLDAQYFGPNAADILFEVLAQHPDAAARFLRRAEPHEVFDSTESMAPVTALLVAGTAPGQMDEATAGQVLVPLVRWAREQDPLWPADNPLFDRHLPLAAALTPWMPALGPRAAQWNWEPDEGAAALGWLLEHDHAVEAIHAALGTWVDRIGDTGFIDDDGRLSGQAMFDLADTLDLIEGALHDARIDDAERDAFLIDLGFTFANMVMSTLAKSGPVGIAIDVGLAVTTPTAKKTLERLGILPSLERERDAARADLDRGAATALVIALTATVADAIDRGELPADALDGLHLDGVELDDPRAVRQQLVAYVDELGAVADEATTHRLLAVVGAFDPT